MSDKGKYTANPIPKREALPDKKTSGYENDIPGKAPLSFSDNFAEIEYEHNPNSAVVCDWRSFKLVPASQLISRSKPDAIRERFYEMRRLATGDPFARSDAALFYKQAKFMEDFTDNYEQQTPLNMPMPCYQRLSYEQLRTYFTWRTLVRMPTSVDGGQWPQTSLSYIFLYVYELLACIGQNDPASSLEKLVDVWMAYRGEGFGTVLDRYLPRWIEDFYIYHNIGSDFKDFIKQHDICHHYSDMLLFDTDEDNCLLRWSSVANYDICTSKFYNDSNEKLLSECFYAVLQAISKYCKAHDTFIESLFVYGVSKGVLWYPFRSALFDYRYEQPDCQIKMPGGNVYYCKGGRWTADILVYHSNKKDLAGYIIKKTEACLREAVKYKTKIKADRRFLRQLTDRQKQSVITGDALDNIIERAAADFHREINRTVVMVDHSNLARIREEAQDTQDKLVVPEAETVAFIPAIIVPSNDDAAPPPALTQEPRDEWAELKAALSDIEIAALAIILRDTAELKAFADNNGIMLEVLADSINEKAMDFIGDNILELDDHLVIYGEYKDNIAEMVE